MDKQRQQAYLNLIELLLNSPREQSQEILNAHRDLIDSGLVEMMEKTAAMLAKQANILTSLASELTQTQELSNNIKVFTAEEYHDFLLQVLQATAKSDEEPHELYILLQANQDKLDEHFAQQLRNWAMATLIKASTERAQSIAAIIADFSDRIQQFQPLKRTYKIEIAITGYETIVVTTFTRDAYPREWAALQNRLGAAYFYRSRGELAENIEQAIRYFHNALEVNTRERDPYEWAGIQQNLGEAYRRRIQGDRSQNIEEAIHYFTTTLAVYNRENFPEKWAAMQNNLSAAYIERIQGVQAQNLEQAIHHGHAALEVFTVENNHYEWGTTKNNLGEAYRKRIQGNRAEDIEAAIECCHQALQVRTRERYPYEWVTTQNNLGKAYLERIEGDREENIEMAISCFTQVLEVCTPEDSPAKWGETKNNLGAAYLERIRGERIENIEEAIRYFTAALEVCTPERGSQQWANLQKNLGVAFLYRVAGDEPENIETAIHHLIAALAVYTPESNSYQWATTQANLGTAYCNRSVSEEAENLQKAIENYTNALRFLDSNLFPYQWAIIENNLGIAYREFNNIADAIKSFQAALTKHPPEDFPLECLRTGRNLGNTAFNAELWTEAIEGYGVAVRALEYSRTGAITDTRRQEILSGAIDVYANIVEAYIKTNHSDQAIEYVERSKARNLVDTLSNRDIYPKGNIPETIINELKRSRQEIVAEQRRLDIIEQNRSSSMGQLIGDSDNWLKDRTRLNELLQQLDRLIKNEIDPIDPSFRATQQVKPIFYSEIKTLLDDRTAIVEWYICNDNFHTFIITHSSELPLVWSSSAEEMQALMDWQNEYLQDYQQNRKQWIEKLPDNLQNLASILHIHEIINYLPNNCDQLILIPHRFLHLIPLHALPLSPNTNLLDHFSRGMRYAPSCQLLQLTGKQLCSDFNRLLAIQNPTKDLGHSAVEVKSIQNCFAHADILIEDAATKAALIEVKNQDGGTREVIQNSQFSLANCIHFSCHAEFNFESPLESALLLANKERITLGEIFDLDLSQCCLVTLSACETGLTNYKILSDEYIGIPSSFIYAGSPSVVSSLWTVQDVSTAFLMIKFYQNLRTVLSIAVALNQAQIWLRNISKKELQIWIAENQIQLDATLMMSLRRRLNNILDDDKPFQSPFHWAAFCAIGQ
ncbi:CHAT domain-containing protein [Calothrix sp. FACHB-156]|uniref:CHAT domain-containing protein n=1 Tax=Nostocaceae TaxID=1162 RepID=UPI001682EC87|nr:MULTISPECIES: CHAT domain-containing protein [Nostocaceae]MBD2337424.1 CHAT domain-containing protein [Calothrix sp. FACHB-156]MBD2457070.1 CHAT domain-containing protein [Nostoc sp. FACHB-87]MBD2478256.1 CHAT domain-containing protein [Anabaena sp. FACHB-83]